MSVLRRRLSLAGTLTVFFCVAAIDANPVIEMTASEKSFKMLADQLEDSQNHLYLSILPLNENGPTCNCAHQTCGCCADISILHQKHSSCLNLRYLEQETGIDVEFTFDGHVVFHKTLSAKHPPEVCFPVLGIAKACLDLYDLDIDRGVSGCARITFTAPFVHLTLKLGCFRIPLSDARSILDAETLVNWMKQAQLNSTTNGGLDDVIMNVVEDVITARLKDVVKEAILEVLGRSG